MYDINIFQEFFKHTHLDSIKIYFTLNSTFESDLLVANTVFKEITPLKLLQVCLILNNWRKDEPKSRPKISLFKNSIWLHLLLTLLKP